MKKRSFIGKFFLFILVSVTTIQTAKASILPSVFDAFFQDNIVDVAFNRIQMAFVIMLGGFLVVIVFYIIRGLQKFASKDNSGDMSEATQIMQRNMIAVGGVFIGVIGVAVVLIFFGINPAQIVPHEICIDASDSYGCFACIEKPSRSSDKEKFTLICDVCDQDSDATFGVSEPTTGESVTCSTPIAVGVVTDEIEEVLRGANVE